MQLGTGNNPFSSTYFTAEAIISFHAIASFFCRIKRAPILTHERAREIFGRDFRKKALVLVTASPFHYSILNSAGAISVLSDRHCARRLRIAKAEQQYTRD